MFPQRIISVSDLSDDQIGEVITCAKKFEKTLSGKQPLPRVLEGKVIATLFFQPSTRTRLSFEAAALKLGGEVLSMENAEINSSTAKGESIEDTVMTVGQYTDLIIIRHYDQESVAKAALVSPKPIINAGDGTGEHPTQALLDLYTIKKRLGRMNNFKIGIVGDLKNGRTTHSLIKLLARFEKVDFTFISPAGLTVPDWLRQELDSKNIPFREVTNLAKYLSELDVLYMTRIQQEYMDKDEYQKYQSVYCLDQVGVKQMKESAIVMHPLPRVDEITRSVDLDPRAAYFDQVRSGLCVRMALLKLILDR
ncbi:MAG: aspartate carbamoyltransferase [Candidatus Berkelbacteria bacterium]|nr:aspartate carbamoyltransferase [Candidatus Berkelbacteria bacterium]